MFRGYGRNGQTGGGVGRISVRKRDSGAPDVQVSRVRIHAGVPPAVDAVAARAGTERAFLRAAWFAGFGGNRLSSAILHDADGVPVAALPFVPVGPAPIGAGAIPGSYWPFRGMVVADAIDDGDLAQLFADPALRGPLPSVLRIGPAYDDATLARIEIAALRARWSVMKREVGRSFVLDIAGGQPKGLKRAVAYERKLAASCGAVGVETIRGREWSDAALEALGRIEAASWIARKTDCSGAKFIDAERRARWRRVLADPVLAEALSATILWVADQPVAFSFDLIAGARQYAIASSYDEAFAAHRVGRIVTAHQLRHARAEGVEIVDLGAGDSGYKQELGAVAGPVLVDCLLVRRRSLATLLRRWWEGAESSAGLAAIRSWVAQPGEPRRRPGPLPSTPWEQFLAALALAAAAMALAE